MTVISKKSDVLTISMSAGVEEGNGLRISMKVDEMKELKQFHGITSKQLAKIMMGQLLEPLTKKIEKITETKS